uniref:Candidate secreted effector n=1 Tax=Meloidogyne incognita TaxID=6306 RepID=A0A914NTM6_MELIC
MHADAIVIASFKISIPPVDAPGDQCFCKYLYIVCAIFSQSFIQTKLLIFFFFIPFIKFILLLRGHSSI